MNFSGCYPVIHPGNMQEINKWMKLKKIMASVSWLSSSQKSQDIHKIMKFKRTIFLDCGIYQMYKRKMNSVMLNRYREKLVDCYSKLKPDLASSLDVPSLIWHPVEVKKIRTSWSIENYTFMRERIRKSIPLVLGISVFSRKSVVAVSKQINKKIGTPDYLGLGGQVPILTLAGIKPELGKCTANALFHLRRKFPKSIIHVYGAGGHRWYSLVRLLGADSADYASFTQVAARGKILLPGVGARYISKEMIKKSERGILIYKRPEEKILSTNEFAKLLSCDCPVCRTSDIYELEHEKQYRLIHNLYVVLKEATLVDSFFEENDLKGLASFVDKRFKHSRLRPVVDYVLNLVAKLF